MSVSKSIGIFIINKLIDINNLVILSDAPVLPIKIYVGIYTHSPLIHILMTGSRTETVY
jgi:hypothetical protein